MALGDVRPKRGAQHVVGVVDENEARLIAQLRSEVFEIVLVSPWQDNGCDPRSARPEDFLLDAANRQDFPTKRNLAGHRDV
jgi:hypothetical protein